MTYEGLAKYKMLPPDKNCALQAFTMVYGESGATLAKRFVDNVAGLDRIAQLEYPNKIKLVLDHYEFTKVSEHGSRWDVARQKLLKEYKNKGEFYTIWWGGDSTETWADSDVECHAFVLQLKGNVCNVRGGNIKEFEKKKLKPEHLVSVWQPKA